ncbi:DUF6602 domain-containing protein [Paraburkholderia denitrificans]|uniref:DUF6602 domain-containing protein n=1 Tax=Paraburkholderia denitrificans TaxID=694025 RepID=A0ABW0JF20_9BURK
MSNPVAEQLYSTSNRLQFHPPYMDSEFVPGNIYDPSSPWDQLRGGALIPSGRSLLVAAGNVENPAGPESVVEWLSGHKGKIAYNLLTDAEGWRHAGVDVSKYFMVVNAINAILRDATGYKMSIQELLDALNADSSLDRYIIEDAIRMYATLGYLKFVKQEKGIQVLFSDAKRYEYERRSYLRSFADELVLKSRRIDSLIRHSGTIGSYREALLRSMLKRLLPARYHVDTGFIEDCPRQLDIIIWDGGNYPALFREADVVVVSRASVRAVIEVKTTLNSGTLREALDIISGTFSEDGRVLPVFKGVFAFETKYVDDRDGARVWLQSLYNETSETGSYKYPLKSFYSSVTAVCVPNRTCILHGYKDSENEHIHPQPCLIQPATVEPGDWQTARFLQTLLEHLILDRDAKKAAVKEFSRTSTDVAYRDHVTIFGDIWHPSMLVHDLPQTMYPPTSKQYVHALELFFEGALDERDVIDRTRNWKPTNQAAPKSDARADKSL